MDHNIIHQTPLDKANTGWIVGNSKVNFHLAELPYSKNRNAKQQNWRHFPWNYEIIWTDDASAYTTRTELPIKVTDHNNQFLSRSELLTDQSFNFYVVNKSFSDSTGNYPLMDLLVYDVNGNGQFIDIMHVFPRPG